MKSVIQIQLELGGKMNTLDNVTISFSSKSVNLR